MQALNNPKSSFAGSGDRQQKATLPEASFRPESVGEPGLTKFPIFQHQIAFCRCTNTVTLPTIIRYDSDASETSCAHSAVVGLRAETQPAKWSCSVSEGLFCTS